jgi:hypothetical protein
MSTHLEQRIISLESGLTAFGGKIAPIEAQVIDFKGKFTNLETDTAAVSGSVSRLERHNVDVDTRIAALAGGLTSVQNPLPIKRSVLDRCIMILDVIGNEPLHHL